MNGEGRIRPYSAYGVIDAVRQEHEAAGEYPGTFDQGVKWALRQVERRMLNADDLHRLLAWELCNDIGNAARLRARFGDDLAYIDGKGWAVWDGKRWNISADDDAVKARAQLVVDAIRYEAAALPAHQSGRRRTLEKWANTSGNNARIKGMIFLARNALWRDINEFDINVMTLNVKNGVLRLGELKAGGAA